MEIDLDRYATVCKVVPAGEDELAEGTVGEILADFAAGKIGRPGALFMRLAGEVDLVQGKRLAKLVEDYRLGNLE